MSLDRNFHQNAGIAIGPILFVIAILAVLVGALAAGSGGFGSSTADDAKRVQATTLIQQGTTIKSAMDRLLVQGFDTTSIIVSPTFTTGNAEGALFAPAGGGLTPQVPPANIIAASAAWGYVPAANLPGIGSTGANDFITLIEVKDTSVCKALNSVIFGRTATQTTTIPAPSSAATITNAAVTASDGVAATGNAADLSGIASLSGRTQGCFSDGGTTPKFYYYQILSAG